MSQKRKIVFIMTDTQRYDMVGCYGNPDIKTPCLDRLAQSGVRFERAYTCQAVCGPARSAIFTGLYPHTTGSLANSVPLYEGVKTIGQRLSAAGLHTAYVGKWHLDGGDYFGKGVCPDGWDADYWYDMKNYLDELTPEQRVWSRKTASSDEGVAADFTFGHRCTERALDFLKKFGDDDFLLTVSYDEPHEPHLCPEPFASMYEGYEFPKSKNVWDTLDGKPEHQKIWAGAALDKDVDDLKILPKHFLGCNSFIDSEIGRVLDAVDAFAPDALIIYTSDHGHALFSHRLNSKGPAMYDEIARIPFLMRVPGAQSGVVCKAAASHIDIVPTILEFARIEVPQTLAGSSLLSLPGGFENAEKREVFMEFSRFEISHDGFGGFRPIRAVFDGRYKLVINLLDTDELYDLEKDPEELINLIDDAAHNGIRNALHDKILAWMNETRDQFRGYCWERRPWRLDARPATWRDSGITRQPKLEPGEPAELDYKTGLEITESVRSIK